MWDFKKNIFMVENDVTNNIYCYSISFTASSFNQDCLGNEVPTTYETLTLTLQDIDGNPVIATENYDFYLSFREKTCLTQETEVEMLYSVISGNSAVSGTYATETYVDCGQGSCELEYQQYISVASTPPGLPSIIECPSTPTLEQGLISSINQTAPDNGCSLVLDSICYIDTVTDGVIASGDIVYDEFNNPIIGGNQYYKISLMSTYVVLISDGGVMNVDTICF